MGTTELYSKFARVWIPDVPDVWIPAELIRDFSPGDSALVLQLEDGTVVEHEMDPSSPLLPPLRNPDILVGENDLTALSYLHEPAVLHNLRVRFMESRIIYTYCGIVLVAINPYETLPIYDDDIIDAYSGQNMGDMDPHIFAVAEEAYRQMVSDAKNQSIIVSGESGAGKTVSAKYAMRYFTRVSLTPGEGHVEGRVLASNPIMEALGNAKTTRNDNSSRFGKFIEMGFDRAHVMVGAAMRTYLLEKSRVVFQADSERNYHIFYQLCASAHLPEFKAFSLARSEDFHCTNQGQSPAIAGVDDATDMVATRHAFSLLGVSESDQMEMFQTLSSILHLSNVDFKEQSADRCALVPDNGHLRVFCELLGVPCADMSHWLCHRKLETTRETYVKPVSKSSAASSRDALCKHIYALVFSSVVDTINRALRWAVRPQTSIGVLDIYGFETFNINSFEQFCINYANEKLQQQFNMHVFKLEQDDYLKEGIPWTLIDFYDNQPCIDLIEAKLGVLDLLEEECKMPKGSDATWAQKLYNTLLKNHAHFEKPRLSNHAFIIRHFADKVEYQCDSFLEKNKDSVNAEQIKVLQKSKFGFLLKLFEDEKNKTIVKTRTQRDTRKSVGLQFRQSLHLLMDTLNATTPHYVRCIKPNDHKASFSLDPVRAVQQLRACGILETIRISAAGFPSRWTYQEFFSRYRVLVKWRDVLPDRKQTCRNLLEKLIQNQEMFQLGRTQVFFRAGQVAYLEKLRSDRLRTACVSIQKTIRCWLARSRYVRMKKCTVIIQKHVRGQQARRYTKRVRQSRAAVLLQSYVRMCVSRRRYQQQRYASIAIQRYWRAHTARQMHYKMMFEQNAVVIQRWVRRWMCTRRYRRVLAAAVLLQSCVRRFKAQKELKTLKVEARSVEHFKKLNMGMENKVLELQHKINQHLRVNRELSEKLHAVTNTMMVETKNHDRQMQNLLRSETESRLTAERVPALLEQIYVLQQELETARTHREELEQQNHTYSKVVDELNVRNHVLKSDVELKQQILDQGMKANNDDITHLEEELAEERSRHQRLQSQHFELEQRYGTLKEELDLSRILRTSSERTDWNSSEFTQNFGSDQQYVHMEEEGAELPVLLKLQRRVNNLELDKRSLMERLDKLQDTENEVERLRVVSRADLDLETLKRQQLETENKKLKQHLKELQTSLSSDSSDVEHVEPYSVLMEQLHSSTEELDMRKQEVLLLRSHMVRQEALRHKDSALGERVNLDLLEISSYKDTTRFSDIHTLNEDGELWLAYEGLKETNRLLEGQMEGLRGSQREEVQKLQEEVNRMKEEKEEQQQLLAQSLPLPEHARIDTRLKLEITRLTHENLELLEQRENLEKCLRKTSKHLKVCMKKVKDYEVNFQEKDGVRVKNAPVSVTRKEKEYQGMLRYKQGDENRLLKNLVTDLKPRGVAVSFTPGLPAYIIFMCLRYADNVNNDQRVSELLNSTISSIKGVIKRRGNDFESVSFWLSNTCRFMNCLKQYSGDEVYSKHSSPRQKQQCLSNFELSEYQQVFNDLSVQIYRQFIKCIEDDLQPLIVTSMLEHDAVQGVLGSKPTGLRKRSSSFQDEETTTLGSLLQRLSTFHSTMSQHGMDSGLIRLVVRQQFYIICAVTLNNLLLRKDMCSWSKGLQIRYNIWQLEEWLAERDLSECGARETLEPLVQAAQLLQIKKKTDADAQAISSMCTALTTPQIVKVLTLYTPVIEFEERVPLAFISNIKMLLEHRSESSTLMMDTKKIFSITLPFSPSSVAMETLTIPASLNLGFITRI